MRLASKQKPAVWKSQRGDVSTNTLGMKFAFIPKGTFWMGGGGGKPGDKQETIPHDFCLGVYTVTQGEWRLVMEDVNPNPSYFSRSGGGADKVKDVSDADLDRFPVEQVSWDDTQEFIERLNELEHDSEWMYRLPTEAEWEYSCRGGAVSQRRMFVPLLSGQALQFPFLHPGQLRRQLSRRRGRAGTIPGAARPRWDRTSRTDSGSTTCTATSGSGATTPRGLGAG